MQLWVDKHPVLFAICDFLFIYLFVSFFISWLGGWAPLARQFRSRTKFVGSRWHFQSASMRWLSSYRNVLTIGADSNGLYLSPTLPFFPLFHAPLFIPWREISLTSKKSFFFSGMRFDLGRETLTPIWVRSDLAERVKSAAGHEYPVETVGS